MTQAYPASIFFDCAGAVLLAAGLANPSVETQAIAEATRVFVHDAGLMVLLLSLRTFTATNGMA